MKRLLTAAAFALVASCADSIPTEIEDVAGSYQLESVNGQKLPWYDTLGIADVLSGELALRADGTYLNTIWLKLANPNPIVPYRKTAGTYSLTGPGVIEFWENGGMIAGAAAGSYVTIRYGPELNYRYRRQ